MSNSHLLNPNPNTNGFTIVELLVVIVVIGILAAISIVSYTGISQKAVVASLQSDLSNASRQIRLFQVENSAYPGSISDCPTPVASNLCLKSSKDNNYIGYSANNQSSPQTFYLVAGNNSINYKITDNTTPTLLAQTQPGVTPGAVLELHAAKANSGISPGINSPFTTTWTDASGNNNHGTLTNMAGTTASGWAGVGTVGDPYKAVFDGVDDYVVTASGFPQTSQQFTIEAYINQGAGSVNDNKSLLTHGVLNTRGWALISHSTSPPYFLFNRAGAWDVVSLPSGASPTAARQGHFVFVVDNTAKTMQPYYAGAAVGTPISFVNTMILPTSATLFEVANRGTPGTSYCWLGGLPLIRYYPFALSATQVSANYDAGPTW